VKFDSRALLREAGLYPKKSFGQNFLVAEPVAQAIAYACVPEAEVGRARVVEIGAGLGALTQLLAERAGEVVAIERDRDLVPILRRTFEEGATRVTVLEADAQTVDFASLLGDPGAPRVLCGNLPYSITGRLLQRAVEHVTSLDRAVFMVQEEVADRLAAAPGTKDYGALTVFTRAVFDVRRVTTVSRACFHPQPEVTSAVVELRPVHPPRATETPTFRALVKRAFEARRKTLRNAWRGLGGDDETLARAAAESGVSLDARGETLDVTAFAEVAAKLDQARAAKG
jgi:16S rRNA (adenine1518-N6/adenine1519-N6)-dimethyltransferase